MVAFRFVDIGPIKSTTSLRTMIGLSGRQDISVFILLRLRVYSNGKSHRSIPSSGLCILESQSVAKFAIDFLIFDATTHIASANNFLLKILVLFPRLMVNSKKSSAIVLITRLFQPI